MFGMGFGEILFVLIIALIVLGPEKIPKTARSLGKLFHDVKRPLDELKEAFEHDIYPESKPKIAKTLGASPPAEKPTDEGKGEGGI